MQHKIFSNGEKDPARLNKAESELQSRIDADVPRQVPQIVSQPNPEGPWTVRKRPKAIGASGPGSEYWLP
jgi:hypothetical protein